RPGAGGSGGGGRGAASAGALAAGSQPSGRDGDAGADRVRRLLLPHTRAGPGGAGHAGGAAVLAAGEPLPVPRPRPRVPTGMVRPPPQRSRASGTPRERNRRSLGS